MIKNNQEINKNLFKKLEVLKYEKDKRKEFLKEFRSEFEKVFKKRTYGLQLR